MLLPVDEKTLTIHILLHDGMKEGKKDVSAVHLAQPPKLLLILNLNNAFIKTN